MNIAAVGTAISFAKFIFLPHGGKANVQPSFWRAMILLLSGLVMANILYYQAYTLENTIKPLITIAVGWLAYNLIFKRLAIKLPRVLEELEHLIGVMTLILMSLFWTVMP